MKQSKIAIIGAGSVGSTAAYTLMLRNLASKILLVDIKELKCQGEVYDLADVISFSSTSEVVKASLSEAGQADIAIITSGIAQQPGQSRIDLLSANKEIVKSVINGMKPLNQNLVIIVVSNPVDILTYLVQQISELPKNQVFGSGTLLDTQRLRELVSKKINIAVQSIHLYVLGEHGDTQFGAWSSATIAGTPLLHFPSFPRDEIEQLEKLAKHKAYEIIECKGSTAFGIASCISAYCQNIISDTKKVTPVSCYLKEYDICLSVPAVLGSKGVEQILIPPFDDNEKIQFKKSIDNLKKYRSA